MKAPLVGLGGASIVLGSFSQRQEYLGLLLYPKPKIIPELGLGFLVIGGEFPFMKQ